MTGRLGAVASALALLGAGCTDDTYVVGAICSAVASCAGAGGAAGGGAGGGGAGASAGAGLELDFTGSGVERLPAELLGNEPTHLLIADDATPSAWAARVGSGFDVAAPGALELDQPAPFADPGSVLAHAGATVFVAESTWADTSAGALGLELVFRGEPGAMLLSQHDLEAGLELFLDGEGRLNLRLDAGGDELVITSPALVADAWHHCLALFDEAQGVAQIFCNGQAGSAANVPAGFAVSAVDAAVTLGSEAASRVQWAELARWQAPTWGPRGAWTDLARERFARLVGTYAANAREPLPFAEVRASGAYVDMTPIDAPELRRLHPVGEHWPRIVCRPLADQPRGCGLLVETASARTVAPAAFTLDQWESFELAVSAESAPGPTGADSLHAVTPSAQGAEHALELAVPLADGPAVFSFFARAGSARLVRAEVVGVASATFDLAALSIVDSTGALVTGVEPWGGGLVRASYSFDVSPMPGRLRLSILTDDGDALFAGDGSVAAYLGDVELGFRSFSAPLPMLGAIQQADHLVYPAGNGNLPEGPWFGFAADVWLPDAPLLADAAIFNANFAARYDQQLNLFVSAEDGTVRFWGLQGDATHWQFSSERAVTDGKLHRVTGEVGIDGTTLGVDGESVTEAAGEYDVSALDRIEIGTSTSSSGPLTGLIRTLRIAPP